MTQTILVADDNLTMQRLASEILSQEGLEVVTVANGVAAIKKIPDLKPLVVLADADMPGKDGYEVCDFIKNQPELNHIRVLLAVSDTDPYDEQRGFRAQIDEIIKKPFDREQLVSTVARCLEQAEALNPHIVAETGNAPPSSPETPSASQTAVPGSCDAALPGTVEDGASVSDNAGSPEPSSFLVSQSTGAPEGAGEILDAGLRGEAEPRESSRDGTPPSLADNVPAVFLDADQTSWAEPQPDAPSPASAGESDAVGLPDGSSSARQTLSSHGVVFLENDYAAPNSPAEIPEEHTTVPAKRLEAEEGNALNSAETFVSPEETQNAFPGNGSGPEEPESQIKRAPVDGTLIASIVRKVVGRMSPPALTAETVQDLEEKLIREIMVEIGTTPV